MKKKTTILVTAIFVIVLKAYTQIPVVTFSATVSAQKTTYKITPALPVANFSASDTAVCAPASITFTDLSTNSPTSWAWTFTGGSPNTSNLQTPPAIGYSAPGDYAVKLLVKNGSGSDSLTKTNYIHVYSRPAVYFTGATNLCQGSTTTITAAGGSSYHWSTGATTSSIPVKPSANITYTVQVANGACFVDTTFTIIVDTMPVVRFRGDTSVCVGDTTVIYASGGLTYSWSNGSTTDSITVSDTTSGYHTYYITVTKGACTKDTMITVHFHICTGIANYSDPIGIEIYPNPVINELYGSIKNPIDNPVTLSITDITGRVVQSELLNSRQSKFLINVYGLAPAVYFIKLQTPNGIVVKKFVKIQ